MNDARKPIFFIGFNKCGTVALHKWMTACGLDAYHGGSHDGIIVHQDILLNIALGNPPLQDIPPHDSWIDVGPVHWEWPTFVRHYPDSKYVLNTRNVDAWIVSRLNHLHGRYVEYLNLFFRRNLTHEQWAAEWRKEFLEHDRAVMDYFWGRQNFMRFDIDLDSITSLAKFLGLDPSVELPRENVTTQKKFAMRGSDIIRPMPMAG